MNGRNRRRVVSSIFAKRSATKKAERGLKSNAVRRTRFVGRKANVFFERGKRILAVFFVQVKKGSLRAIAVLAAVIILFVGLPVTLLLTHSSPAEAAPDMQAAARGELMMLETQTYSDGGSVEGNVQAGPTPTPVPHPENGVDIKRNMNAPVVTEIQQRLMELGYMEWDEPTDFFGPNTSEAVRLFQRQHGLTIDGVVGLQTYTMLMAEEAQKYTITVGVEDDDVKELQIRLRELGYINKATSYFGDETEAAVKKFQERNGLTPDGKVGEATREMLYSEDAKAYYYERGEVSEQLKKYQNKLKDLGYLTTTADGKYGKDTETAVKRFQERNGMIADGYLGPSTISVLMGKNPQANALMIGMNGSDVTKVQNRLAELGYMSGKATGHFGEKTETAVRDFQSQNKLSVDGKIGKHTLSALMSSKAKKSDGSTLGASKGSSSGSSGGSSGSSGNTMTGKYGANAEGFIAAAESRLGSKYVRGAKGPNSFDCSGFVYWALNQAGVPQGYMTSSGWQKTNKYQRISGMSNLKRGDVVSFKGHVGIYLGDGRMIDASSSQGKVRICTNIQGSAYWKRTFVCGYRIF